MFEYGKVIKADGDSVTVSFKRKGKCDGCRTCAVSKGGTGCELTLPNRVNAVVSDYVKVRIFKKGVHAASIALYCIALALTALGAGLGIIMSVGASVILAILGFVVGLAFAVPIDVCVIRRKNAPQIVSVCSEAEYIRNCR